MRVEGQHGAEGGVAVKITVNIRSRSVAFSFTVEVEQCRVDSAADDEDLVDGETGFGGALDGGAARVHDERTDGATGTTQELEGDDAVLAAADGDKVLGCVLNLMPCDTLFSCRLVAV